MKDEIKETLDYVFSLAYGECFSDEREDIKKAEDYITNLQKENNNLKEDFKRHIDRINELEKELEQEIAIVGANRTVDNNNPEWWYKLNCYGNILDKLKALKEGK
jgi:predicted RNase H-like nuclease (RuvC/YqgF family)